MNDRIRAILKEHVRLPINIESLNDEQNLYDAGMSSHATVNVMLALEDEFDVEFPARLLRRSVFSSVASIRHAILELCDSTAIAGTSLALESAPLNMQNMLQSDCILDESIRPGARGLNSLWVEPARIFLTGATGFLGAFLLAELLERTSAEILCLVRARDEAHGYERLQQNLRQYGLWQDRFMFLLRPVLGDLALPQFGLNNQQFQELADNIDCIHHNGALVNFSRSYADLRASNVQGTQEILRFASCGPLKPVHYISTIYVHDMSQPSIQEDSPLPQDMSRVGGYIQSKWVSEQLLSIARERGIPISIYRPGRITGDSQTGIWQEKDFLWQTIIASLRLRSFPDLDIQVDMTPVDYVSRAIIALSLQVRMLGNNFHLVNLPPIHLQQLAEWIRSLGYELNIVSYSLWREKLMALGRQKQSSIIAVPSSGSRKDIDSYRPPRGEVYTRNPNESSGSAIGSSPALLLVEGDSPLQHLPHCDCRHVQDGLKETNITCPVADISLLRRYISSFMDRDGVDASLLHK